MTQWPSWDALLRALSATSSWPCPRDTLCKVPWSMENPSFSPAWGEYLRYYIYTLRMDKQVNSMYHTELLDILQRIHSRREDEEHRGRRVTVLIQLVKLQPGNLHVFRSHTLLDKVPVRKSFVVMFSTLQRWTCALWHLVTWVRRSPGQGAELWGWWASGGKFYFSSPGEDVPSQDNWTQRSSSSALVSSPCLCRVHWSSPLKTMSALK